MWSNLLGIVLTFGSVARYTDATSSTSSLQSAADLEAERITSFKKRIIGGVAAKEDEFRFLLYLRPCENKNSCYLCGGTIIAKDWILTAAHCVSPIKKYEYVHVYFGKHQEWDKGDHDVKLPKTAIHVHAGYSTHPQTGVPVNDIALIHYKNAAHGFKNFPLLAKKEPSKGMIITVAGWGVVNTATDTTAKLLRKVSVPVHSDAQCKKWVGAPFAAKTTWCAGLAKGGKDACQGDSGGPAFRQEGGKFKVYGIVSYGAGCGQPNSPGVYASVAAYRSWIFGVMNGSIKATTYKGGSGNKVVTTTAAPATTTAAPVTTTAKPVTTKPSTGGNGKGDECTFMQHLYGKCPDADHDPWWGWDLPTFWDDDDFYRKGKKKQG